MATDPTRGGKEGPPKETPPVKEKSTEETAESRPVWESLEAFARQGVQRLLQQLLEEEVEHALGRRRYARRGGGGGAAGGGQGVREPRAAGVGGGRGTGAP